MGKKEAKKDKERRDLENSESSLTSMAGAILDTIKGKAGELGETWRQGSESALEQAGKTLSGLKEQAQTLTGQKSRQEREDRNEDDRDYEDDDDDEDEDKDEDGDEGEDED